MLQSPKGQCEGDLSPYIFPCQAVIGPHLTLLNIFWLGLKACQAFLGFTSKTQGFGVLFALPFLLPSILGQRSVSQLTSSFKRCNHFSLALLQHQTEIAPLT